MENQQNRKRIYKNNLHRLAKLITNKDYYDLTAFEMRYIDNLWLKPYGITDEEIEKNCLGRYREEYKNKISKCKNQE